MQTTTIALLVAGGCIFLVLVSVAIWFFFFRKNEEDADEESETPVGPPAGAPQPTPAMAPVPSGIQPTPAMAPVPSGIQPTPAMAPVPSGIQPTPAMAPVPSNSPTVSTIAGTAGQGFADGAGLTAQFNDPVGVAHDITNNKLYVAETGNNSIRMIDLRDNTVSTIAGSGTAGGFADGAGLTAQFRRPSGVAHDITNNKLYVADYGNNRIRMIDLTPGGTNQVSTIAGSGEPGFSSDNTIGTSAIFRGPRGIAFGNGILYIAESDFHLIRMIDLKDINNPVSTIAGNRAATIALAGAGGGFADGAGLTAQFNSPVGVAHDITNNKLYVADYGNNRIRMIDLTPGGTNQVSTIAGTTTPRGVAHDITNNKLYVAETGNNRIRMIDLRDNTVSTIAGAGSGTVGGFADGAGLTAQFNSPVGVAYGGTNKLYVAETGNNMIRMISL